MTTRKALVSQVGRMACLQYFPATVEAKVELVDTFEKCCLNDNHAKRTVDHIIESVSEVPTPTEIRRVALELRPEVITKRCEKCGGTGWLWVTVNGIEGVDPCSCRRQS